MAENQLSVKYNLRQMNNEHNNGHLLWYPKVVRVDTLSLRGLAEHIFSHGSPYTRDTVIGVLTAFRDCMVELLSSSVAVKLDGLGTFYPSLESKGAESPIGYNIRDYIKGLHIRFLPEGETEDNLTSVAFGKNCRFKQNMIFDLNGRPKKVVDGALVDYGDDDDPGGDNNGDNNG